MFVFPEILEDEATNDYDTNATLKAKTLYKSCIDTGKYPTVSVADPGWAKGAMPPLWPVKNSHKKMAAMRVGLYFMFLATPLSEVSGSATVSNAFIYLLSTKINDLHFGFISCLIWQKYLAIEVSQICVLANYVFGLEWEAASSQPQTPQRIFEE